MTKQIYAAKALKPEHGSQGEGGARLHRVPEHGSQGEGGARLHRVHRSAPDFVFRTMKSGDADKAVSICVERFIYIDFICIDIDYVDISYFRPKHVLIKFYQYKLGA